MIKLSERLSKIANFIGAGESMADIGTDHGLLPIFLLEHKISTKVILSDIGEGPLEKAKQNLDKYCNSENFDLRQGNGLETLQENEVDTVVIAGMGGKLMIEIVSADMEKSKGFKKFIFQPRNAPEKLELWLLNNDFEIEDAVLAREGKYIWEIFLATPFVVNDKEIVSNTKNNKKGIIAQLIRNQDPLFLEFINGKIHIEQRIIHGITTKSVNKDMKKLQEAKERLECMREYEYEYKRVSRNMNTRESEEI